MQTTAPTCKCITLLSKVRCILMLLPLVTGIQAYGYEAKIASHNPTILESDLPNDTAKAAQNITRKEVIPETGPHKQKTVIYFVGIPDNLVLNCGEDLPAWPVVTATDNHLEYQVTPREVVNFTPCGGRTITRSWTTLTPEGEKVSAKQEITFSDSEAPILNISPDTVVDRSHDMPLPFYEASDQGCSSFVVDITEDEYNIKEGTTSILRKFVATDGCGNTTTKIQHIHFSSGDGDSKSKPNSISSIEYR